MAFKDEFYGDPKEYIDEKFIMMKCNEFFRDFFQNFKLEMEKKMLEMLELERLKETNLFTGFGKSEMHLFNSLESHLEYIKEGQVK